MKIQGFIWHGNVIYKLYNKHNVTPGEVEEAFEDKPIFLKKECGKVEGEDLYNALGRTVSGRYLSIFFIYKSSHQALIVSARDMDRKERRYYDKRHGS